MLELIDIKKDYYVAGGAVHALKGVSLKFRKNEFVSILGASGCGKTTLLNIIGGLDKYTSGDLVIEGVSTKQYTDREWDTYRNHSIGFIFQSYHLIPHQTILQNVELALTIAGVDKEERRRRAIYALEKVGLADKINNRPNQLSGGQAQRVAIARALINNPEIVLADEPTGALDSKTSVQIMDLLKEIAKDRLVIMVTHNPDLAERYSTRIIRLLDGEVVDDSMPFDGGEEPQAAAYAGGFKKSGSFKKSSSFEEDYGFEKGDGFEDPAPECGDTDKKDYKGKKKNSSMSFGMAFSLSLKNLLSKKRRTIMVSVAGSIGIIGVSMVLAISSGVRGYIDDMENDMLSGYPLTVTKTAIDFTSLMDASQSSGTKVDITKLDDKVYVNSLLDTLMSFSGALTTNNITKDYEDYISAMPSGYCNAIQYGYNFDMSNYIYTDLNVGGGDDTTYNMSVTGIRQMYTSVLETQENYADYASLISTVDSFSELPDNYEYILSQYDILATYDGVGENTETSGRHSLTKEELADLFESKDSIIMVLNDNSFSDLNFGQYGYMTEYEFLNFAFEAEGSGSYDESVIKKYEGLDFSAFVGKDAKTFTWYPNDEIFSEAGGEVFYVEYNNMLIPQTAVYKYNPYSDGFSDGSGIEMKVKVILQKKENISYGCLSSGLYYTNALTRHTLETSAESKIADYLAENDALSWMPYNYDYKYLTEYDGEWLSAAATGYFYNTSDIMTTMLGGNSADALKVTAGIVAADDLPTSFSIYPVDFDSKSLVTDYLDVWNRACSSESGVLVYTDADGVERTVTGLTEADKITYNDTVGLIITMVNTMIEMITVALVAFTALSLVVSTVMIGIITYVSVVERIKEIGILRAVGARKKDIKRLFNAETFIIGLVAGLVGIAVTYILSLIINVIVGSLTGIYTIAALPVWQALIMVAISVALTLISGLIPASAAAKKDPVVALRTE